jgi:hypothetical protein
LIKTALSGGSVKTVSVTVIGPGSTLAGGRLAGGFFPPLEGVSVGRPEGSCAALAVTSGDASNKEIVVKHTRAVRIDDLS